MFCSFIRQISITKQLLKLERKVSTFLKSLEFLKVFYLFQVLTKFKNNQILLNTFGHIFMVKIKLSMGELSLLGATTLSITIFSIIIKTPHSNHCYAECHLCLVSHMLSVTYAECHLCWVSLMLSVTYAESHLCWESLLLSVTYAVCDLCWVSHMVNVTYAECYLCCHLYRVSLMASVTCGECHLWWV